MGPETMTDEREATRWGFVGAGQMASALVRGMLRAGVTPPGSISVFDPVAESSQKLGSLGVSVLGSNPEVARASRVLVLAVKPQAMTDVLAELQPMITPDHLVISIAAGVPLATLEAGLGPEPRLAGVLPNTPALVGEGASAFCLGASGTDLDAALVSQCLGAVGRVFRVPESLLDAVTGLSGSGPAFVYLVIEALADGGVRSGLPRALALSLAAQTVLGAAKMVLETGLHPGVLKDQVASPAGTTIAGLHALEQGGLRGTLIDAVHAATLRSRELAEIAARTNWS